MSEPNGRQPFSWRKALTRLAVQLLIATVLLGAIFGALAIWWAWIMSGMSGAK